MIIFSFALRRLFRRRSNILLVVLLPLLTLLLPGPEPGQWLPLPQTFQYYGLAVLYVAARLTVIVLEDRNSGILLRIGVAPITHLAYLGQVLLAFLTIVTALNIVVIGGASLLHGLGAATVGALFVLFSLFSVASIGLCLAWYTWVRDKETASLVIVFVVMLLSMLGGMMWPIQIMPTLLQQLAVLLPTYWLVEGLLVIATGAALTRLLLPLGLLFLFSIAFLLIGSTKPAL